MPRREALDKVTTGTEDTSLMKIVAMFEKFRAQGFHHLAEVERVASTRHGTKPHFHNGFAADFRHISGVRRLGRFAMDECSHRGREGPHSSSKVHHGEEKKGVER